MKSNRLTPYGRLNTLNNLELLSSHSEILMQSRFKSVIRIRNNPVGSYAEWPVSNVLGMTLLSNSLAGVDTIDTDGLKMQIEARRVTPDNPSWQLNALRSYESAGFDYLTVVIFDETYDILNAYKIPHEVIRDYARYSDHANAYIVNLRGVALADPRVASTRESLTVRGLVSVNEAAM